MTSDLSLCEMIFVARQPIFRPDESVWGYELLFRSGNEDLCGSFDGDQATSSVIADGVTLAREGMNPDAKMLINFPGSLLAEGAGFALPKEITVIEILENVKPDKAMLKAVRELKDAGYTIAVDDYFGQASLKPFLDLADIVKVDILELDADPNRIRKTLNLLPDGLTLLAEKVEDGRSFELLAEMGFSLFQGFFFSQPEIIPGKKLTTNEMTKLQLMSELAKPDFEPRRLAEILQSDPNLAYRLLRYINSAGIGLSQKITSLKRAIDMMGLLQAKQWLRSALIADLNPSPKASELAYLAVHRAKFLESVCNSSNMTQCQPDALFMTGLFSLLDAMLGVKMDEILPLLPLDETVVKGLQGEGEFHELLRLATSYERLQWAEVSQRLRRLNLQATQAELMYVRSRNWTQKTLGFTKAG